MSEELMLQAAKLLMSLGLPPNVKGFHYLRAAILLYIASTRSGGALKLRMTKEVYPEVAGQFATTVAAVERAVRHVIHISWHKRNRLLAREVFRHSLQCESDVPSNSLFISACGEWLIR